VEAVAGERPPTAQHLPPAGGVPDDLASGGDHRRVPLVGIPEQDSGPGLADVAGEDVAAAADDRAPGRAPVDGRDPLQDVERVDDRGLEAAQRPRQSEAVHPGLAQGEDHIVRQAPVALDVIGPLPHQAEHRVDRLLDLAWRLRHHDPFLVSSARESLRQGECSEEGACSVVASDPGQRPVAGWDIASGP
jgi:hypothetical protein